MSTREEREKDQTDKLELIKQQIINYQKLIGYYEDRLQPILTTSEYPKDMDLTYLLDILIIKANAYDNMVKSGVGTKQLIEDALTEHALRQLRKNRRS